MTNVAAIENVIFEYAPEYMKMQWDNVGLLCGRREKPVEKILVALDPFTEVCHEAAEIGADLIVTHHPLIFKPLNAVTDGNPVGESIIFLIEHGIAAINAHTNLDQCTGGVNDCLAEVLGLSNVEVINPVGADDKGFRWGLLRIGTASRQELKTFSEKVKASLKAPGVRYVDAGRSVKRVAVGGGACGGCLADAAAAGADTFVTSDVKYNQFQEAIDLGINLIDAGHFETEWPVALKLAEVLKGAFPEIDIVLSKANRNPVIFG